MIVKEEEWLFILEIAAIRRN